MPYTLAEWAVQAKDPITKGAILGIRMESVVADILTFRNTKTLTDTGVRFDELPTPAYTAINGTINEETVKGKPISFGVYKLLHHIDIDNDLQDAGEVIESPVMRQTTMALKAASFIFNDRFINGDRATDPNGFDGINVIIGNLAAAQTIGATTIDISDGGATAAIRNSAIDRLDEGMDAIEGHMPSAMFGSIQFLQKMRSVLRQERLLGDNHDWVRDNFETVNRRETERTAAQRPSMVYRGIPFYDLGFQRDQSTQIITNVFADTSGATTRVFGVKMTEDDLEGIQKEPLNMKPIGGLEDKDSERWRMKWTHGIAVWGPRSLIRIDGLDVVA